MEREEVGSSRILWMVGGEADGPVELRKGIQAASRAQERLVGVLSTGNPAQPPLSRVLWLTGVWGRVGDTEPAFGVLL